MLGAAIRSRVLFPGRRKGSETSLSRLLRTARRGSQVPVRLLLVDGHGKQPRVRQQAATVVRAVTRRTGRSLAKRRDRETRVQLSRHGGIHRVRQEELQNSRAVTRSINILALVSYIRVLISRTCNHLSFPKEPLGVTDHSLGHYTCPVTTMPQQSYPSAKLTAESSPSGSLVLMQSTHYR